MIQSMIIEEKKKKATKPNDLMAVSVDAELVIYLGDENVEEVIW